MTDARTGSKYLYQPFEVAHERIDANARVQQERWNALERRLEHMETTLIRLDRRLWLAAAAVVTFVLTQGVRAVLQFSTI
ncbi:MAG: hypothetical protein AAGJ34_07080 [Pseudomonadota bacterium]